jgi:putative nucleotidyltransferase with HDIG domain
MQLPKPLPQYIEHFMQTFRENGYLIYAVGGPVRDRILQRPVYNWDFTTNATPEQMLKLFPDAFCNNDFGTVSIIIQDKDEKILTEVTPFRNESSYSDNRHPDKIEWAQTLEEDVKRRDFTINALATDGKEIIDYVNGLEDMEKKVVRAVGDANKRFEEDALRLMRAIRFATQLEFMIEEETKAAIEKNSGRITNISWERIRDEFLKILASDHPAEGVLFLKQTGLLKHILPEVEACFGIEQKSPGRHHVFDVGTHLIEALRGCPSGDPITRFATLLHDIGKASTYAKDPESGTITFYNHEMVGAQQTEAIADRFRLSKKDKAKLVTLVRYHMFPVSENQTDSALRRFIRTIGVDNLNEMLALRTGDRIGGGATPTSWRTELFKKRLIEVQKKPFTVADLKISGHDVMKELNVKPGPEVGKILNDLFEKVVEKNLPNDRDVLLQSLLAHRDQDTQ